MGCRELLEQRGGIITQYTGDGFFAHWPDTPPSRGPMVETLKGLGEMQQLQAPAFRWVLHVGAVSSSGSLQPGEDNLMGPEVHFVFRMEGLAKALARPVLLSEAAARRLEGHWPFKEVGRYGLKGFEGRFAFYSY
jgi:class 3 adenylate cyclase